MIELPPVAYEKFFTLKSRLPEMKMLWAKSYESNFVYVKIRTNVAMNQRTVRK
jgi:hypothetical protein